MCLEHRVPALGGTPFAHPSTARALVLGAPWWVPAVMAPSRELSQGLSQGVTDGSQRLMLL